MPAQLNAPNYARQLSQPTMCFDGLEVDDQMVHGSSRPKQLNLVSPPHSTPLNALANDPLNLNQPEAQINDPPFQPRFLTP